MSKSAEVPFIARSTHIPPALSPPPRYSPGKNPRFLYLYNRKFLVLISLLLFLIAITLIVGVTLICFSRINGSKELDKSKSDVSKERPQQPKLGEPSDEDVNTPHNLRVPEKNDDVNRPLSQRMEPQKLGPAESEKEEKTSHQRNSQATTPPQEVDRANAEAPQATEEMKNQADKRRLILRVEPQKLEGSQQQKKEATRPTQVHLSALEATIPPQESMSQHANPLEKAQETTKPVNQPPERTKATVKPFIPPRERNIIPCDETCTNGGAVATCCRAHRMSDGICDESSRAICWKD